MPWQTVASAATELSRIFTAEYVHFSVKKSPHPIPVYLPFLGVEEYFK